MPVTAIVGEQRGDEGKGRFTDMLAKDHTHVVRSTGANNAGHSIELPDGRDLKLHSIPSGVANEGVMNVIAPGSYINANAIVKEIATVIEQDIEISPQNLKISYASNLILPHHISQDQVREKTKGRGQGTTQIGISFAASDLALREGITARTINNNPQKLRDVIIEGVESQEAAREAVGLEPLVDASKIADKYVDNALKLGEFITDTVLYINRELRKSNPAHVLLEGAQAFLLDPLHGMVPHTTSSPTTVAGLAYSMGVPPFMVTRVVGVSKAVQSHVGSGPFPTEIKPEEDPELYAQLHGDMTAKDAERGTTTGRKRRLGYLDLAGIRRAQQVNGTDVRGIGEMAITKLDWVPRFGPEVSICVAYDRKDKQALPVAPGAGDQLEECTPVYETLPTWSEDIQGVTEFEELPENARRYIHFIEDKLDTEVTMIGVGRRRDQVIDRKP